MFIKSIRLEHFVLYFFSIQKFLAWLFALDYVKYASWFSVHLCDIMLLQKIHPDISTHFHKDKFKDKNVFLIEWD